jgi:hypothetical protein
MSLDPLSSSLQKGVHSFRLAFPTLPSGYSPHSKHNHLYSDTTVRSFLLSIPSQRSFLALTRVFAPAHVHPLDHVICVVHLSFSSLHKGSLLFFSPPRVQRYCSRQGGTPTATQESVCWEIGCTMPRCPPCARGGFNLQYEVARSFPSLS